MDTTAEGFIWFMVIMLNIYLLIVAFLCFRHRVRRTNQDLIYFLEGNVELINPNVPIHEQAHLLPYDTNYEFPTENLARGKRLGSGAFGCVEEAVAYGIVPYERQTKVAVKMINDQAGEEVIYYTQPQIRCSYDKCYLFT